MNNKNEIVLKSFYLAICLLISVNLFSQTYIKFNLATPFIGGVNPAVETAISKKWTFSFDVLSTFRNETDTRGPFRVLMVMPEGRYYFKEKFKGFYGGVNAGYALARMTKPDWWGENNSVEKKYDVAWIITGGFSIGYEYCINKRWMVEAFVGGGRAWSMHERFFYPDGGRLLDSEGKPVLVNGSEEYLPYRGGINICYKLGRRL